MNERIVMRVGEALVAGGPPGATAEPEIVIGELDGPVGQAFAQLIGDHGEGAFTSAGDYEHRYYGQARHAHGQQGDAQKKSVTPIS